MEISFYKQHTRADRICLLGGVNHTQRTYEQTTQHRRLLPRRCCTNHGSVHDVLVRHTSRLDYALFVIGISIGFKSNCSQCWVTQYCCLATTTQAEHLHMTTESHVMSVKHS